MRTIALADNIFLVNNFWSHSTCDDFIRTSESKGYEIATVQTERGPRLVDHVRNNHRVMYTDFDLAESLWRQAQPFAPNFIGHSDPVGLNELFRFYRYEPGQQFRKHRDQSFIRNSKEASYYTFMIYLNDDFKGGATKFDNVVVNPKKGSALIFYHYLEHEGSEVIEGVKYVLRTDVMYRVKDN